MEQDSSPVVPVSLEFGGVRVTLSLPESVPLNPKRARTTITPKLDLTEAPPIPTVPAFHPGTKTKRDIPTKFEFFEFKRVNANTYMCGSYFYSDRETVELACDRLMHQAESQVPHGKPGYTLAVLKQIFEMLNKSRSGDHYIAHELSIAIELVETYYTRHPSLQERIDELDGIRPDTSDNFIEFLVNLFDDLDNLHPNSDAGSVLQALKDFDRVFLRINRKLLTLSDVFIE